ncbi:hypothetical protein [Fulvimarina sp. MAC3]
MNRNAKLVFEVLAFPMVMAFAEIRIISMVGGFAVLSAAAEGGSR